MEKNHQRQRHQQPLTLSHPIPLSSASTVSALRVCAADRTRVSSCHEHNRHRHARTRTQTRSLHSSFFRTSPLASNLSPLMHKVATTITNSPHRSPLSRRACPLISCLGPTPAARAGVGVTGARGSRGRRTRSRSRCGGCMCALEPTSYGESQHARRGWWAWTQLEEQMQV